MSTNVSAKRMLVSVHGYFCAVCGIKEWQGKPIGLEVDHINGDNSDYRKANLRLVCPNCHSQTPTYKAKNKGKGRAYRRKS